MERTLSSQTPEKKGESVRVEGWVDSRRDHGKIIFLDIRDREGMVQVVFTPQAEAAYAAVQEVRPEWVVAIEGVVQERPASMKNPDSASGEVEISAEHLRVYSQSLTPPFPLNTDGYEIGEEHRLKYRYLDLRRKRLQKNLRIRSASLQFIRNYLSKEGFVEIETPILTKSTPEGARDFVVPSRLYPGTFYALPQSPQQYKQLLQIAGHERYFQVVRCFRDEDPRADRQPEFTQLDIEMSFTNQEEILSLLESLYIALAQNLFGEKHIQQIPFPRIPYKEAMEKWGTDKPDLRKNKNDPDELAFAFITDFPAFEWKEQEKRWDAVHHPFTLTQTNDMEEIKKDPGSVLAYQYDLALNGYEVAGGSLRIYDPEFLTQVLEFMGNKREDIEKQFGHLLSAFQYGAPPHGGIASGLDRLFAVLLCEPSIRETMAFPKTGDSRDLMMDSPSEISEEQLNELSLSVKKQENHDA
ncbi:MAG: aspartate--tRNA ligase [Candidatus Yanofskybacteria bacterium]|nr:aspartate--tRNA ligase [Candidatus Yanofskybacteria bacterium]